MTSPKSKRRVWVVEILDVKGWAPLWSYCTRDSARKISKSKNKSWPGEFRVRPYRPEEE